MCKQKTTGEILAMKIHKKDVVVAKDTIDYILTEKRVLRTLQINTHPFLPVRQPSVFNTTTTIHLSVSV